jgi:serine phosphatase RsbU (regulator of sigma subunit)
MNLYSKLTVLSVALVAIAAGALFFFTNLHVSRAIKAELVSNLSRQSERSVETIEQFILSRQTDVRMAALNPYMRIRDIPQEELNTRLAELKEINALYSGFSYYTLDSVRIADSNREGLGEKTKVAEFWAVVDSEKESMVNIGTGSGGNTQLELACLVRDYYTESPLGILVGSLDVNSLYALMGNFQLDTEGERNPDVFWIDSRGAVIYTNTDAEPMTRYDRFDLVRDKNAEGVNVVDTDEDLLFVTGQKGYLDFAGENWKLIIVLSKAEAYAPLYLLRSQILIAIGIILLISVGLALGMANIIVKPIAVLSKSAEAIGRGDLKTQIDTSRNDEIGKLAKILKKTSQMLIAKLGEQRNFNQELEKQKRILETQKREMEHIYEQIHDSINYSKRIQHAILPDINELDKVFADKFLIYRPKDVVSGDFYWFERIRTARKEHMILVVADCTGHGVPGAIMSMIGSNQLTNIVYYQNYIEPEKILARLNRAIKFELYRDSETAGQRHDGMEVGVCVIDLDTMEMIFAGAAIPLYMVRNGELEVFKSPKVTIGQIAGSEREVEQQFKPVTIKLQKGDKLYLSSDGFQDQFGGPSDRRYMAKNFRELISKTSVGISMSQQGSRLEKTYEQWKGQADQTDDVVVLGVEV